MKINPTYVSANDVLTTCWIPRDRFTNLIQIAAIVFGIMGSLKITAIVVGVWWAFFFAAYLYDPKYLALLWRALWRAPSLCPIRAHKSDRERILSAS